MKYVRAETPVRYGLGLNAAHAAHAAGSQRQREDRGENQIDESHHDADDDAADDAVDFNRMAKLTREPVCAERGAENQRHAVEDRQASIDGRTRRRTTWRGCLR